MHFALFTFFITCNKTKSAVMTPCQHSHRNTLYTHTYVDVLHHLQYDTVSRDDTLSTLAQEFTTHTHTHTHVYVLHHLPRISVTIHALVEWSNHTSIHTHIHTHTHTHTHLVQQYIPSNSSYTSYIHAYIHIYTHLIKHSSAFLQTSSYMHTHTYTSLIHTHTHTYLVKHSSTYTHTHTHTHTPHQAQQCIP